MPTKLATLLVPCMTAQATPVHRALTAPRIVAHLQRIPCAANGDFLMNPASGGTQNEFSACTVGNICAALGRNSVEGACLTSNSGCATTHHQRVRQRHC